VPDLVGSLNEYDKRLYTLASELAYEAFEIKRPIQDGQFSFYDCQLPVQRQIMPSGTSRRFGIGCAGNSLLACGWSDPDESCVWSNSENAHIVFSSEDVLYREVKITLQFRLYINDLNRTIKLVTSINGHGSSCHRFILNNSQIRFEAHSSGYLHAISADNLLSIDLNVAQMETSIVDIGIKIEFPRSPASLGLSTDLRNLGVALCRMDVV
jgi:hypothetical protein